MQRGVAMADEIDRKRLEELAESDHRQLEDLYHRMRDLRELIASIHDDYVNQGSPPAFDRVEAVHLMAEDAYGELERYLIAACGQDVAVSPVERPE
ncbi:MAG TPA: hypothetical protein VF775_04015 [Geobacteraceae bacterium]